MQMNSGLSAASGNIQLAVCESILPFDLHQYSQSSTLWFQLLPEKHGQ